MIDLFVGSVRIDRTRGDGREARVGDDDEGGGGDEGEGRGWIPGGLDIDSNCLNNKGEVNIRT